MNKFNNLKKKAILKLVDSYITTKKKNKKWVAPGEDWIQYSGPYFNSDEFVAGVRYFIR
jgi:hypothetical protein